MKDSNLITREIISRSAALQFFQTLVQSNEIELATAVDWIQQATIKLSLADCAADLRKFAEHRGVRMSDPESILGALFTLEALRTSLSSPAPTLIEYLVEEAREEKLTPPNFREEKLKASLERFFSASTKLERTLRAQKVYYGFLPTFEDCSSLVEFRPVFDEPREKIINGIVAATVSIMTEAAAPDGKIERLSFQVDLSDIDRMTVELRRLRQKIKALSELVSPHTTLLNPSES